MPVHNASLLTCVLIAALSYVVGGLPFGYLLVRVAFGKDVRTMGSGNIGATNVHRTAGGKAGIAVLLLDVGKGFAAVWLAAVIAPGDPVALGLAAFAVILGHCYPLFLGFKGGKGVACYVGAFLYIAPLTLLVIAVLFFLIVAVTRYVSLASIVSATLFPLGLWLMYRPAPVLVIACAVCSLLILYRHRANIQRLRQGSENVFSLKSTAR